jgi:hypothetical protein
MHVILAVAILIMLVIIAIPSWRAFRYRSQCIACEQAMKSASDGLIIEYLGKFEEDDVDAARDIIDQVMVARPDICPVHGNIYLVKEEHGIYQTKCGLHDPDTKERTCLNATYVRDELKEARKKILKKSDTEPDSIEIMCNGKPLECIRVTEEEVIHRGTKTTNGYKGVVAYYGVKGDFEYSAKGKAGKKKEMAKEGDICYLVYADEDHCAIWRATDGWTGDAYEGI